MTPCLSHLWHRHSKIKLSLSNVARKKIISQFSNPKKLLRTMTNITFDYEQNIYYTQYSLYKVDIIYAERAKTNQKQMQ